MSMFDLVLLCVRLCMRVSMIMFDLVLCVYLCMRVIMLMFDLVLSCVYLCACYYDYV